MRIAMLAPRPNVQGPLPKHTPLLVEGLRELGCEVELLPWGRRQEGERMPAKLLGRARDVLAARRAIVERGFPVVVVKTAHDWNTLVRDIVLTRILPADREIVVQFHGSQSPRLVAPGSRLFKWATRALLARTKGVLVLSRGERSEWVAFRPQTRVLVVRNVRPDLPEAAELEDTPVDRGAPEILCVSRLLAGKGVLELVRALALVLPTTPCRLVIVGDGEEAESLRSLSDELDVREFVDFPGYLGGVDLAQRYRAASIFALPTALPEGLPTVLLEALAAGLPIVTTPSRGAADHLVEGENALFVPPHDPPALAAALVELLGNAGLRAAMSTANRIRSREFDAAPVSREYLSALTEIVDAPTAA